MEILYTLPALILALAGLIGLRKDIIFKESKLKKEHENQLAKERIEWENEICELEDFKKENRKLNLSNRSLKGANTKHKATIEELKEKNQDQADTIKRLINKKGQ